MAKKTAVQRATMFIPITRVDDEAREVWGYATTEQVDSFGTIFDYEASKRAYQEWANEFEIRTDGKSKGNLRAMHQMIAAGKVIAVEPDDDARAIYVGARVVDEAEWKKVKEGVYTGFSHGAVQKTPPKAQRRNGQAVIVYDNFSIEELSLADNPSNPGAVFTMARIAGDGKHELLTPIEAAAKEIAGIDQQRQDQVARKVVEHTIKAELEKAPPPETTAAASAPAPTPAAAASAATAEPETGKATPIPATPAAGATATERISVPVALLFDPAKFAPEQAEQWAQAHEFRVRKAELADNGTHVRIAQRNQDHVGETRAVRLAEGVDLLMGDLKPDSPAARFSKLLRTAEPDILRAAQSQGGAIIAGLQSMAALCDAIDRVIYGQPYDQEPSETARADVGALTAAAESILDFIGSRLREQLASMVKPDGEAARAAKSELERLTQLPQILTHTQLQRLMDEDETKTNMTAMHEIGHSLVDATMKMGAECAAGTCRTAGAEGDEPEGGAEAEGVPPKKKDEKEERVAAPAPAAAAAPGTPAPVAAAAPAPATATERVSVPTGQDQVLQAIGKVGEHVREAMQPLIGSLDARLKRIEDSPTRIGRPPAAPADKTLAGSPPNGNPGALASAELSRLAERVNDPTAKEALLKRAAELLVPSIGGGAQRL